MRAAHAGRARAATPVPPLPPRSPAAAAQNPGTRADQRVTLSISHKVPSAKPASVARANGERASAANSAATFAVRTTIVFSRGAARHSAASPKKTTAATEKAPFQPSQSDAISTKPDASMPTR